MQSQRTQLTTLTIWSSILSKSLYIAGGFYTKGFQFEFQIQTIEFEAGA